MISMKWTAQLEIGLLYEVLKHRPIGINRHFEMLHLHANLNREWSIDRHIAVKDIWNHLSTLYDLKALNELADLPFPNAEAEFSLPDSPLYSELKENKFPRLTSDISPCNATNLSLGDATVSPSLEHIAEALSSTENIISPCKESVKLNEILDQYLPSKTCDSVEEDASSGADHNSCQSEMTVNTPKSNTRRKPKKSKSATPKRRARL